MGGTTYGPGGKATQARLAAGAPHGAPGWMALAAVCAAGAAVDARAEFDSERDLIYSLGPITLRPQLEVGETYDSNVFYSEEDEVDDFITTLRPGLRAVYGRSDQNYFSLTYTLDASFYQDRDDLNNVGHLFSHQSRFRFSRLLLQGQDQLTITDTLLGGSFSYIGKRIGQVVLTDNWRADYEISPRTSVGIRVGLDYVDYDAKDLEPYHLYDYLGYSGGFRVGYLPSEKIVLFPEVTVSQAQLSANSPLAPEAPDLFSYGFSIGAEGEFSPKLTGIVTGGYEFRQYSDDTEIPDGWIASLQLRWQMRPKTAVMLAYRHWIQVSRESFGYAFTGHRPAISLVQELGTRDQWTVNLDAYYQFDDYEREAVDQGRLVLRKDDAVGGSLRVAYRWQPWLVAYAAYDLRLYEDNISTVPNYAVHRISLRLAAGY